MCGAQAAQAIAFEQCSGIQIGPVEHGARGMAGQRPGRFAGLVVIDKIEIVHDAAIVQACRNHAVRRAEAQRDKFIVAVQFDGIEIGIQQHAPFSFVFG